MGNKAVVSKLLLPVFYYRYKLPAKLDFDDNFAKLLLFGKILSLSAAT